MKPRTLLPILLVGLACISGFAQSYQSSFTELKYDRANGPSTMHGSVEVEASTGAVNLNFPLGPGIGARGIKFRPLLSGHVAPTVDGYTTVVHPQDVTGYEHFRTNKMKYQFSFSPGFLDLALSNDTLGSQDEGMVVSNYSLPDGSSGTFNAQPESPQDTALPSMADLSLILTSFGYSGDASVGLVPKRDDLTITGNTSFVRRDSNGNLVLGLQGSSWPYLSMTNSTRHSGGIMPWVVSISNADWRFPQRILVVRGDVAFEYTWLGGLFGTTTDAEAMPTPVTLTVLRSSHYRLTAIRNRFGEAIAFNYDTDGFGYTAIWMHGGGNGDFGTSTGMQIRVAANPNGSSRDIQYSGVPNAPSFTLTADEGINNFSVPPLQYTHFAQMNDFGLTVQPYLLTTGAPTYEQVSFTYGPAPANSCRGWSLEVPPEPILMGVTFPNRTMSFTWTPYLYGKNFSSPGVWGGYSVASSGNVYRDYAIWSPSWFYGVSAISDTDTAMGHTYTTLHTRTIPAIDYVNSTVSNSTIWASTAFNDVITHPDASVTAHRFVEPVQGSYGGPGDSQDHQMQTMAHLKHLVSEMRSYAIGTTATQAQADLANPPQGSSAYKIVSSDRWSLFGLGNPTGGFLYSAVPSPTRTRVWTKESTALVTDEADSFDQVNLGWRTLHHQAELQGSPSLIFDPANSCSRMDKGTSAVYPTSTETVYSFTARQFQTYIPQWFLARLIQSQMTIQQDGTGNVITPLPAALPISTTFYDNSFNRVTSGTITAPGGTSSIQTVPTPADSSTNSLAASQLLNVTVGGSSDLTGQVGVQQYQYDSLGFLKLIQPMGVSWNIQQVQDGFGHPTSQTDPNSKVTSYTWDAASRLTAINPPDGLVSTVIQYEDNDHLGATVTRGVQVSENRYDGLGRLVLVRRWDASTPSHKVFTYDAGGRKTFESVWRQSSGSDNEGLLGGTDGDVYVYDNQGRLISHSDPNGVLTSYGYNGLTRTVTLGGNTTTITSDAVGRMVKVTDALSQDTKYQFDAAGHVARVVQTDNMTISGTTLTQTRNWGYHALGWLSSLIQPESGETDYSNFTVTGKPQVTTYKGDGINGPSKTVKTSYGSLMRVTAVWDLDGTVNQVFGYDGELPAGATLSPNSFGFANNRMNYAKDGVVEEGYTYSGPAGLLSQLLTRVWVNSAQAGSTSHDFPQTFSYTDGYGNRTGGTTPAGTSLAVGWDLAKGAPSSLKYGNTPVATANYDPTSWALINLSGSGWVSSFGYDNDQARLKSMTHGNTTQNVSWTYHYDASNRLTSADEQLSSFLPGDTTTGNLGITDHFSYDSLNRLISTQVWNLDHSVQASQSSGYDGFGNSTSVQTIAAQGILPDPTNVAWCNLNNITLSNGDLTTQAQTNRLPKYANGAATGVNYDGQGNLLSIFSVAGTSGTNKSMIYDALGRVTQLGDSARGVTEVYAYTAVGMRTLVETWQGSILLSRAFNLYNDGRQLVSQYSETLPGGTNPQALLAAKASTPRTSGIKPLTIYKDPCGAAISAPTSAQVGQSVLFNGSTDYGTSASWTFGDGGTASGFNPSHVYTAAGTYTVSLRVTGPPTTTTPSTATMTIIITPAVSIGNFSSSASTIRLGENATLSWSTSGATIVNMNGSGVALSGTLTVTPLITTTYTLVASNSGASVNRALTVYVVQPPAIEAFTASPTEVLAGSTETLSWSVSGATSLSISPGIGDVTGRASVSWATSVSGITPVTTTYTLTATNTLNGVSVSRTAPVSVTVDPDPTVPTISFSASSTTIGVGTATILSWNVSSTVGVVAVTLNGAPVPAIGTQSVSPGITTPYVLSATSTVLGTSVPASAAVTVTVIQKPVITFNTAPLGSNTWGSSTNINLGQSASLAWSITNNPTSVGIDNGLGTGFGASGSATVSPTSTTTYTLSATNLGGTTTAQVTVSITPKPVIASFTASPATIVAGRSTTLTWNVQGGTTFAINGTPVTGTSAVVAPVSTQIYTLTATNGSGSTPAQVTVTVAPAGTLAWTRDILYLGGKEIAEIDAQGFHVTQTDHLGSPFYALSGTGTIVGRQKYMPFGETLDQRGSLTTAKGFTNHEQTDATGLVYMQARFYAPQYHRFLSPDPARDQHFEETQSWNIYSYVQNNPTMKVDPTGMLSWLQSRCWRLESGNGTVDGTGVTNGAGSEQWGFGGFASRQSQPVTPETSEGAQSGNGDLPTVPSVVRLPNGGNPLPAGGLGTNDLSLKWTDGGGEGKSLIPKSVGIQISGNADWEGKGISVQGSAGLLITPENNGFFASGGIYDHLAKTLNLVRGAVLGGGLSLVFSNASNINEIKGNGFTVSGNVAAGPKALGGTITPGANGVYVFTIAFPGLPGLGLGASRSLVDTKTIVSSPSWLQWR